MMLSFSLIYSREPSSTNNELSRPFSMIFLFKYILFVPEVKLYSPNHVKYFQHTLLNYEYHFNISARINKRVCFTKVIFSYVFPFLSLPLPFGISSTAMALIIHYTSYIHF